MKKLIGVIVLLVVLCSMRSGGQRITKIVAEGVRVIPPCSNCRVTPFEYEGKIGFALNSSDLIVVVDPIYDDMYNDYQSLCDGMFSVETNGKWGAIDTKDEYFPVRGFIPCVYDTMGLWRKNKDGVLCSKVTKDGKAFYINRKGERI